MMPAAAAPVAAAGNGGGVRMQRLLRHHRHHAISSSSSSSSSSSLSHHGPIWVHPPRRRSAARPCGAFLPASHSRRLTVIFISNRATITTSSLIGFKGGGGGAAAAASSGAAASDATNNATNNATTSSAPLDDPSFPDSGDEADSGGTTSPTLWSELQLAVRQGDGARAEEVVDQVLQEYQQQQEEYQQAGTGHQGGPVGSPSAGSAPFPPPPTLDVRVFRLVLRAWKNCEEPSLASALRAHRLLQQMEALAEEGMILHERPTMDDYLAVMECWNRCAAVLATTTTIATASGDFLSATPRKRPPAIRPHGGAGNSKVIADDGKGHGNDAANAKAVAQYAEELWNGMQRFHHVDDPKNGHSDVCESAGAFVNRKQESYRLMLSILALTGKGSRAEEVLEGAKQDLLPLFSDASSASSKLSSLSSSSHSLLSRIPVPDQTEICLPMDWCRMVLDAYIHSPETRALDRAESFLQRMHDESTLPVPDTDTYNALLRCWASRLDQRQYRSGDDRRSQSKGNHRADQHVAQSPPPPPPTVVGDRVEHLLHQMEEHRIQANFTSYHYGIDTWAKVGDAKRAEALLTHLVKDYMSQFDADLKFDIRPFQRVLWAYSQSHLSDAAERAESVLDHMEGLSTNLNLIEIMPTTWSYNLVLKCWSRSKSPDAMARCMALYERMLKSPPAIDEEGSDVGQPHHESDMCISIGTDQPVQPDTTSMNTVLNASSIMEQAFQTEKLLWKFYDRHIQDPGRNPRPDSIAFSTVIKAWSKSRDRDAPDRAEKLLRKLLELYGQGFKECRPDVVTYSSVLQCWAKSKKKEAPSKAESLLRRLQTMAKSGVQGIAPDTACWNSAIAAWGMGENGERAEALFREMLQKCRQDPENAACPNGITLTNVLNAWAKTRDPEEAPRRALALLEETEHLYNARILKVKPNVISYSVVMDCLAYARSRPAAEKAESMLRVMAASKDPQMHPNVISYNSVIKAWTYSGDSEAFSKVMELFTELVEQSRRNPKLRPNSNSFGSVLKALADSNVPDKDSRAQTIVKLMNKFECELNDWSRNELRKCLNRGGGDNAGRPRVRQKGFGDQHSEDLKPRELV